MLRFSTWRLWIALFPLSSLLSLPNARAVPHPARRADEFADSVGVCLHVQNYNDADWLKVKAQLGALGVRSFRDGLEHTDDPVLKARLQSLYEDYGMKMLAVCGPYGNDGLQPRGGSLAHVAGKVAGIKSWLVAVEGPNEPEYFWFDGWNYGGFADRPRQVVWYQNALYDALKADPRTKDVPVTTFALARGETAYNWFKDKPLVKHDILAWHHYNGRFLPNPYDVLDGARLYLSSDKPAYLTEHGYRVRGDGNVTQRGQMKLDARSLSFFFDFRGNVKTFFYVAGRDTAPGEDYGLDNADLSPRPAYTALQSILKILSEGAWNPKIKTRTTPSFRPSSLEFALSGDTAGLGWRLLQKSSGSFFFVTMPYVEVANRDDGSDLSNAPRKATLSFGGPQRVVGYFCDDKGNYSPKVLAQNAFSVEVEFPDTLAILEITPVPGVPSPIPFGKTIALKTSDGSFVSANTALENAPLGKSAVKVPTPAEKWTVEVAGPNLVALKSVATGKYVSCNVGAQGALQAGFATSVGTWEPLVWQDTGNQHFQLQAQINGQKVLLDGAWLGATNATDPARVQTFSWVPAS